MPSPMTKPSLVETRRPARIVPIAFLAVTVLSASAWMGWRLGSEDRPADPLDLWRLTRFVDRETTFAGGASLEDFRAVRIRGHRVCGEVRWQHTPARPNRFEVSPGRDWHPFIFEPAQRRIWTPDRATAAVLCR